MPALPLVFAVVLASLAACGGSSSSSAPGGGDGGAAIDGSASDAGAGDDSSMASDAYNPPMPVLASAGIGPIAIGPYEEKTVCILKRLGNPVDIVATSFVADLAPGSHHLIVYKTTDTQENLTPYACQPFQGLAQSAATPILLVGKPHIDYKFPAGVGVELAQDQMLRIEAHYINATGATITGQGTIQVEGLPSSQAGTYQRADFGFWGTVQFNIQPNATFQTPVSFQKGIPGTHVFAASTHQHHLGTEVKLWQSAQAGDTSNMLIDEHDWSNPVLASFALALDVTPGSGFSYQCSWNNTTTSPVTFGESANNEMCFVALYYYPSHGFDRCIDGQCTVPR